MSSIPLKGQDRSGGCLLWEEVRSSLLDRLQPACRKHCWGFSRLGPGFPFPPRGAEPCLCRGGPILLRGPGGLSCVFVYESLAALEAGGPLWNPDPSEDHISTGHLSSPDSGFLRRLRSCAGIVWLWV